MLNLLISTSNVTIPLAMLLLIYWRIHRWGKQTEREMKERARKRLYEPWEDQLN